MGLGGAFKALGRGLASVAPSLAGAAISFAPGGGVVSALGRVAIQKAAEVLGVDTSPADGDEAQALAVAAALETATPDQLLALKKADQEFSLQMRNLELDRVQIYADDRADARSAGSKRAGNTTAALGWVIIVGFYVVSGAVLYMVITEPDELNSTASNLIFSLLSYVAGVASTVCAYYFGSSSAADNATDQLTRSATTPPVEK